MIKERSKIHPVKKKKILALMNNSKQRNQGLNTQLKSCNGNEKRK